MKQSSFVSVFFCLIVTSVLLCFHGCKDNYDDYIPYVPVTLRVDLSIRNELTIPSVATEFVEFGYAGVIVVCGYYDVATPSQSVYYAYDAACTSEVSQECSIEVEDGGCTAVCPCCGARYSLLGGYPMDTLSSRNLKPYNVKVDGSYLMVYN